MTSRIHLHNANTISHLSQEAPLPFKKYTKKRSWVWDWFEQDPENKYRAVCLYCHQEIFRLDGDRGSPKKLITHVNSKHGINKENYSDPKNINLRLEKLKEYVDRLGPLVTNRDDAISMGIMNSGVQSTPILTKVMEPVLHQTMLSQHGISTPDAKSIKPVMLEESENAFTEPRIHQHPHQHDPSHQLQLPHQHQLPQHTPVHSFPVSMHNSPAPVTPRAKYETYLSRNVDTTFIDPSLAQVQRQTMRTEKQEEIDKYNDLVLSHNKQIEAYNKAVVIKHNGTDSEELMQKPMFPLIESMSNIHKDPQTNDIQKALQYFIAENSSCFNNLKFIESPSFKNFVKTLKENQSSSI